MVTESDNDAADPLWARVGGGGSDERLLPQDRAEGDHSWAGQVLGRHPTSPADRIRLLKVLVKGGRGIYAGAGRRSCR